MSKIQTKDFYKDGEENFPIFFFQFINKKNPQCSTLLRFIFCLCKQLYVSHWWWRR